MAFAPAITFSYRARLRAHSRADVVEMTIFLVDISKNKEVWRARREFFSGDFPASTLVEVSLLAGPETLVAIETVAYLGEK